MGDLLSQNNKNKWVLFVDTPTSASCAHVHERFMKHFVCLQLDNTLMAIVIIPCFTSLPYTYCYYVL